MQPKYISCSGWGQHLACIWRPYISLQWEHPGSTCPEHRHCNGRGQNSNCDAASLLLLCLVRVLGTHRARANLLLLEKPAPLRRNTCPEVLLFTPSVRYLRANGHGISITMWGAGATSVAEETTVHEYSQSIWGAWVQGIGGAMGGDSTTPAFGHTSSSTIIQSCGGGVGGRGWYTPDQSISVAIRWDNIIHLQKDTSSLALSQNTRGLSSQGTPFDFVGAEITEKISVSGIFFTYFWPDQMCLFGGSSKQSSCLWGILITYPGISGNRSVVDKAISSRARTRISATRKWKFALEWQVNSVPHKWILLCREQSQSF